MQPSAITHSTALPFGYFRLDEINFAAALAMSMVCFSNDSRTPPRRPSIVGRIPILGAEPINGDGILLMWLRCSFYWGCLSMLGNFDQLRAMRGDRQFKMIVERAQIFL